MEKEAPLPQGLDTVEDLDWADGGEDFSDILGFDFATEEATDRSGLRALVNSAIISHRRLPVLDVIFDRTARRMSTSLRQFADENVEVVLDDVTSTRFGDFIQGQEAGAVIGVARSKPLGGYFLICVDGGLVCSIVDLLLGGRRETFANETERQLTPIELGLAQRMLTLLADSFSESFKVVFDPELVLERIETTARFAAIAQEPSVCALAKFRVMVGGHKGKISILSPHATIETVKDQLARDFIGDVEGDDAAWREALEERTLAAELTLSVVLAERRISLRDIISLKEGDLFSLGAPAQSEVSLQAGDVSVARGRVGRANGRVAVRLGEPVDPLKLEQYSIEAENS